ncbi:MAG: hypothetical protein V3T80_06930 [Kiloniellales bacterium]
MSSAEGFLDPQNDLAPTPAAECVGFVSDNQTHGVIESVARQFFDAPIIRDGGSQQALEYLAENPPPKVIIVDIGDSSAPLTAMLSLTAAFTEETRLIGIGTINDINLYREMVGAGITDYLVKPVTEKALAAALARAVEPVASGQGAGQEEQAAASDKVNRIAVIGSRGGVGASSLAVNLAWVLGQEMKQTTALVDLDLEFGTVALSLDLEPTRGLREALESPGRIDSLFIESATAKLSETFSVMATEETLSQEIHFNPDAVDLLFDALGRSNDNIIVDLPRSAFSVRQRVMEDATRIILVTEMTLPCLRDSMRIVGNIEEVALGTPICVVANRIGSTKQAMQPKDFEKALGRKIDYVIPDDEKAFQKAANEGKPLTQISTRGKAGKVLRSIASEFGQVKQASDEKKSKQSWTRIFKRG